MLFLKGMRPRLFIASFAAACALIAPAATAHAANTLLRVRTCEAGDTPKHRAATFYARMYAVKGTNTMAMRFTLINKAGDGPPTVVDNPSLSQWRKSRPKVARFGYSQSVEGLEPGGVYAVQVQFRWLDARGKVIRSVKRTSKSCRQQGSLPKLSGTKPPPNPPGQEAPRRGGGGVYPGDLRRRGDHPGAGRRAEGRREPLRRR